MSSITTVLLACMRSQSQLRNDKYIMMQFTNWIKSTPSQQQLFFLGGGSKCMTKWQFLPMFLERVKKDPFLIPQMRVKDTFT